MLVRGYRTYGPVADQTFSTTGTGFSVSGVFELAKGVHAIGTTLVSDGGGRYMIGQAPDFIVNADASITTIGSTSGMAGDRGAGEADHDAVRLLRYRAGSIRGRLGRREAYRLRHSRRDRRQPRHRRRRRWASTMPSSARPRYGSMQLIAQYSYVKRTPWSVPDGTPTQRASTCVYVNFRYVLP